VVRSTGWAIHHTSKAVHRLLIIGTGFLVIASCLLAGASWRLAQGPIDLGWLADRVRAALADDAAERVSFDGLALAWEGFQKGVDHPLDLRVSNLIITDPMGRTLLAAPNVHLTLSFAGLLLGRLVPRAIEVDHGRVTVTREAAGQVNLGWGLDGADTAEPGGFDLDQFRRQVAHPASGDHGPSRGLLDQIRRAHFRDTAVMFQDRGSGLTARVTDMDVDLARAGTGRIHGSVQGRVAVGGEQTPVAAAVDLVPGVSSRVTVSLTSLRPAAVAGLPPAWAFLAGVDVPVSISATAAFDAAFNPGKMQAAANFGAGRVRIGQDDIKLRSGTIALSGTKEEIVITKGHLDLTQSAGGAPEDVDISGRIAHFSDRLTASLAIGVGQIDLADLPRLWPAGIGSGARSWVTEHVTSGMVTSGTASLVIEADEALRDVVLTKAAGDLNGSKASFTWLDNMPPIEQAEVRLHLVDADTLDIRLISGRQRVANHGADLLVKDGAMRITGLSFRDQIAKIHTQVEGPVLSALALLSEPRLHLLSAHPIGLAPAGGDASTALDFQFPLDNNLQIDDVQIHATTQLTRVRVPNVVADQDLDDGVFDLSIDKDGLGLKGRASLARIPVTLDGTMDFNRGPADQIVQKIALTGKPEAAQLDAAGLHVTDVVTGPIPVTATLIERRSGDGSIAISGDLTQARLEIGPLAWRKPPAVSVSASATLLMVHDRPTKLDRIAVRGDGVAVNGSANFGDGQIRSVQLDTIRLGRTQGHGTMRIPANDAIDIVLQGDQIDLSPKLTEKSTGAANPPAAPMTTPAWKLAARFDRAILANGENASDVLVNATGGGEAIRLVDAVGRTQGGAAFSIKIEPSAGKRRLAVEAKDAGRFLRGLDAVRVMQSGHLTIDGVFDTPAGSYPLAGTAVIDGVVVRNSPVLGKLLQAITLYGLVDALRGPGMTFARVVVPFQYDGSDLTLNEARAANPSLGLTAKGRIGLSSGQVSISGTIVPAYFFNSMLGQLPLVGKLFSPEKGGGLFAARFGLEGPLADPAISINPVSTLTPGFLRGIFGIFDNDGTGSPGATPKRP
jgi:AsmA-like C-terminal region/Protein of unknown function